MTLPDLAVLAADRHGMFLGARAVLAMASGGADSTALVRWLSSEGVAPGVELSVLHVNHQLRGADADADEAFVVALCSSLDVPVRVVRYDVAAWAAETGLNLEDAGRRVRYRFADEELDAMCLRLGARPDQGRIAVAHTLDDQVETFLMRLVTGAGPGGLSAIPPVRGRIVRPLIGARRADVVAYLEGLGQTWREDATNADTTRIRARIRHDLTPVLESINPRFVEAVERAVGIIAEEDRLLDEMTGSFVRDFADIVDGEVTLHRRFVATLSRPMRRRTVRAALAAAFPESGRLELSHIEAIVDGIDETAFARDLPDGLRAMTEGEMLVITRDAEGDPPVAPALLEIPGRCDLGHAGFIEAETVTPQARETGLDAVIIDADTVGQTLVVDAPRPGDRFRPLGMTGTKKLSDLLIDAKVPKRQRRSTPVVRDGKRIVWVAGVRMSDDVRMTPDTRRALRLSWVREEDEKPTAGADHDSAQLSSRPGS